MALRRLLRVFGGGASAQMTKASAPIAEEIKEYYTDLGKETESELGQVMSELRASGAPSSPVSGDDPTEISIDAVLAIDDSDKWMAVANSLFSKDQRSAPSCIRLWKAAADAGNINGKYSYATCLYQGMGTEKDATGASKLFAQLARAGHPWSQYALANMFFHGEAGLSVDHEEALSLYTMSAQNGVSPALFNVANMHARGQGVSAPDEKTAVVWYQRSCDAGDPFAKCILGTRYSLGQGVQQCADTAFKLHMEAAQFGLASAQFSVGTHYFMGRGVGHDFTAAARFFQSAAEQGLVQAQINVGNMYREGRGVTQDEAIARRWYEAAAGKSEHARALLADMDHPPPPPP